METSYLKLLSEILETGDKRIDRTGVGTLALFGKQLRFDLQKGFPLLTTKKMAIKPIIGELLWFIEGSCDERRLAEITYGTRDSVQSTIWTANAQAEYWKKKRYDGDLGRVYGVQWRNWRTYKIHSHADSLGPNDKTKSELYFGAKVEVDYIDQLSNIINTLKTNPSDRRMILSALNVGEIDQMALPPCHMFCQFFVSSGKLSCQVYMRSVDTFLGLPFNIASYALLTHMVAQVTNLEVGELIMSLGDTHIYLNHQQAVEEQLSRTPFDFPKLNINKEIMNINSFIMDDFSFENYQFYPSIKAVMAV